MVPLVLQQSSCLCDGSTLRWLMCLKTLFRSHGGDKVSSKLEETITKNARSIDIEVLDIHTIDFMSIEDHFMIPCYTSSIYFVTSLILQT